MIFREKQTGRWTSVCLTYVSIILNSEKFVKYLLNTKNKYLTVKEFENSVKVSGYCKLLTKSIWAMNKNLTKYDVMFSINNFLVNYWKFANWHLFLEQKYVYLTANKIV